MNPPPAPAKFTLGHLERMAEQFTDFLEDDLHSIARNRGRISGHGYAEHRLIEQASDEEIACHLFGLRSLATSLADWLEGTMPASFEGHEDPFKDAHAALRRHGFTYDQLDALFAGVHGECLHRRHPQKPAFPGRLRKLNETIARIRAFRVALNDAEHSSDAAADLGYTWHTSGAHEQVFKLLLKLEWADLDDAQRAAWKRCKLEERALGSLITAVRERAYQRRQREYQAREQKFRESLAKPSGERSAAA
jgi:SpoVK/Ycf46/Vps4 family AAA+-type ATPase